MSFFNGKDILKFEFLFDIEIKKKGGLNCDYILEFLICL